MNLSDKHAPDKPVSATKLFHGEEGAATSIQILKGEQLKEHVTITPAFLVCIKGEVVFENEKDLTETLKSGDFLAIEPTVKHRVNGIEDSQLILFR